MADSSVIKMGILSILSPKNHPWNNCGSWAGGLPKGDAGSQPWFLVSFTEKVGIEAPALRAVVG